jgi:hypothetical protein
MGDLDFLVPVFGILVALVPVTGLTTVLTLRFGGKPFVETVARELKGAGILQSAEAERRLEELREQVETLSAEVERLREARSFDERLLESRGRSGRST